MQKENFCLIFVGRSGSSYLMSLLRSHPQVVAKGEILTEARFDSWDRKAAWIANFYSFPRPNTIAAVGFKTKWQDVQNRPAFQELMEAHGVLGLFLRRRNIIEQVVSWCAADELYKRSGTWNVSRSSYFVESVSIAIPVLQERLGQLELANAAVESAMSEWRTPQVELWYEDLIQRPADTLSVIQSFLHLNCRPLTSDLVKHVRAPLRQFVTNYAEIVKFCSGTVYARFLVDELSQP